METKSAAGAVARQELGCASHERKATRSRSPPQSARESEQIVSYASTYPTLSWVIQRSPTHAAYYNISTKPGGRAPAVFAFFKDLEWSRVPFEPKKAEGRPLCINLEIQTDEQLSFLRAVDAWAVSQIAARSEEMLGAHCSEADVNKMEVYRKPWFQSREGNYSPRVDARLILSGPPGLLTEIITMEDGDGVDGPERMSKGKGEDRFRSVSAQLGQWRDHRVRAILRADSFRVFEDKTGQRKVALAFAVKELHIATSRKREEGMAVKTQSGLAAAPSALNGAPLTASPRNYQASLPAPCVSLSRT